MKPEKALEKVNNIISLLSPEEKEKVIKMIDNNITVKSPCMLYQAIANLYNELTDDLRKETAKASGNSKALTAAKRILKSAYKECLQFAYTKDGKQYFTDGFRLAVLKNHLPLPPVPKDEMYPDVAFFDRMIDINNYKIVDTPDINKLQAYVKIQKANGIKHIVYSFGEEFTTVDANYLLDMITIIQNAEIRFTGRKNALILVNDSGDVGLLMPINAPATPKTKLD